MKDNNDNIESINYSDINSVEEAFIKELIFKNDDFKKMDFDIDENTFCEKLLSENPDLKELYSKKVEEAIDGIADVHGEASCLIVAEQIFKTIKSEENTQETSDNIADGFKTKLGRFSEEILTLEFYEKNLIRIRNFFRYEIMRYKMNVEHKSNNSDFDKFIEEIWSKAIKNNSGKINYRYKYPIRKRIEFIFKEFIELFIYRYDQYYGLYYDHFYENMRFNNEYYDLWQNIYLYKKSEQKRRFNNWHSYMRIMRDSLSFFRVNKPGTYGHLLWIFLYISELSYFKKETSSDEYWKDFEVNEDNLNVVFSDFLRIQENSVKAINNEMQMCYMVHKSSSFDYEDDYKRIKSVLWKDKRLREEFIYTKSYKVKKLNSNAIDKHLKGNFGQRCFAILTDSTAVNKYVAISGNNKELYKLCMSVFDSKLSQIGKNPEKYKFIEWNEYKNSLYVWGEGIYKKELSQTKIDNIINSENIIPPKNYSRMFSCAERRLVHKYMELDSKNKSNTDIIVISKKSPCYMCERVLKDKNIKLVSFEAYTQTNDDIQKELDFFADKIYSLNKKRNPYF